MKILYKNIGAVSKTFYGVTFNPGDIKEVEGYINAPTFIRVDDAFTKGTSSKSSTPLSKPVRVGVSDIKSVDPKPTESKESKKSEVEKPVETK